MATTDSDEASRRNASVAELIRSLISDVTLLLQREGQLAKIELKDKASKAGVAVGILAAGATVAICAIGALTAAAILALALVLPAWAAATTVSFLLAAIATALILVGRSRLRATASLAPWRTINTVQEDIEWMRLKTEQLKASE